MRKFRRGYAAPLMAAALLVAGCAPTEQPAGNGVDNEAAKRFADKMAGTPEPLPPAKPFARSEKTEYLEFSYAYPAPAAQVPQLVQKFDGRMKQAQADALKMAQADAAEAKKNDYPFRAHSLETTWSVAADTPRFLVLDSQTYVFTGGAHGMTAFDVLLWDRRRQAETSPAALMTSQQAFADAIRDRFCAKLDEQRAEKRGAPVVRGDDEFTQCIDPLKEVLVPTSKDGKRIDGITVVIGPYSAGPYAEGSYEIDLPVDKAMLGAIKTEYQGAFVGG